MKDRIEKSAKRASAIAHMIRVLAEGMVEPEQSAFLMLADESERVSTDLYEVMEAGEE